MGCREEEAPAPKCQLMNNMVSHRMEQESLRRDAFVVLRPASGDSEAAFTAAIGAELANDATVLSAYLAICSLNAKKPEVALCLAFASGRQNYRTLRRCQQVFGEMFHANESLAILLVNSEQEATLGGAGVRPFFAR
jgi:hypothetical protein